MSPIEYVRPNSPQDVVSALNDSAKQARVLSGGSDLLVQLREGRKQADVMVDLKVLPQANGVSLNGGLKLGAAVPCQKIYRDQDIARVYPCLIDSASLIGGMQIQARASLGGNLCNSSPAADSIPSLLVLGTVCHIRGPQGERTVQATEFCTGVGTNVLQKGEYLESFEFPAPSAKSGAAFLRF
ncbi:MAG: FAD binding domain-containing protein, partial [Chloroflexi bacterium]|nr:FAD binding domain-containing protein [Chloroflexota bacterium]